MIQRSPSILRAAAAVAALAAACGSNSNGPLTNLHPVFFRTMSNAPVVTANVTGYTGPLATATITYDSHPMFDGWRPIGNASQANASTAGVATIALPANTYSVLVDPGVAGVGRFNTTVSVAGSMSPVNYATSKQTWTISAPSQMSAVRIELYQTDSTGKAMIGTKTAPIDPNVLSVRQTVNPASFTTSFNTELFPGTYKAVITATPANSTNVISPLEMSFTAAGGGALETPSATLQQTGNVLVVSCQESTGAAATDVSRIVAYDASSLVRISDSGATNGTATLNLGNVSNVIVSVNDANRRTLALQAVTAASPTTTLNLTRYAVSGNVKGPNAQLAASGPVTAPNYGTVSAYLKPGLGSPWDDSVATSAAVSAPIADALGTYSLKLFTGSFSVIADGLSGLPRTAAVALNVSAPLTGQVIAAPAGGVISGSLVDSTRTGVSGTPVEVVSKDPTHTRIAQTFTDANGNFTVPVASGTYEVFVGGALSGTPSVSAPNTATLALTQFQITGRLVDSTGAGLTQGTVDSGNSSTNITATSLGTYTLTNVVQGVNWFLFTPSSAAMGFSYEPAVQIDSSTIKSL